MKSITAYIAERRLGEGWKKESDSKFDADILAFDEPSEEYGIDGGKISKLMIRDKKSKEIVCNYDRDWDVEPTDDVKDFYDKIIKKYN